MKPTREDEHAIVDLLDVLLEKGVIVQADVLVTVADVPLIGINLRAAIAGMHTMREYGFFEEWDRVERQYGLDAAEPEADERAEAEAEAESGDQPPNCSSGGTNDPAETL